MNSWLGISRQETLFQEMGEYWLFLLLLTSRADQRRVSVAGFSPPSTDFSGGDPTFSSGQGLIETFCENGTGE